MPKFGASAAGHVFPVVPTRPIVNVEPVVSPVACPPPIGSLGCVITAARMVCTQPRVRVARTIQRFIRGVLLKRADSCRPAPDCHSYFSENPVFSGIAIISALLSRQTAHR